MPENAKTGLVLGKFLPPHLGHLYLLDFAQSWCDRLFVVVGTLASEPIPGHLRHGWIKQLMPGAEVIHLDRELPQYPHEHPRFWDLWREALLEVLPIPPQFVFASETYGHRLADELDARYVPVDPDRTTVPISGTSIRADPWRHWKYLPRVVRPYFAKRVCVFGPESTGKSTLTRDLAAHFHTAAVPEYARTHLEAQGGAIEAADIEIIARGQIAAERATAPNANRLLVCDTNLWLTTIWSRTLFGDCPAWIEEAAATHAYDLYLLTDVDVPYVDDSVRYLPEERRSFFNRCRDLLESKGFPYVVIGGSWEQRFQKAVEAVASLLPS